MPINPTVFNTGRDLTVTMQDVDTGATVDFGGFITDFEPTSTHDITTIKPIDQANNVNHLAYGNYRVSITVERATGALYDLEAKNRADFKLDGTNHRYTVTGSYRNKADGQMNKYQFTNCLVWLESFGQARKDQSMPQRLMAEADDYEKVS